MSELNFPKNPAVGQEYTFNSLLYMFDGVKWVTKGTGYNPVQDLYKMYASDAGASLVGVHGYDNVQAALENLNSIDGGLQAQVNTKINADFVSRFDREALRRSYADAGYNLVIGSFESGGTLTTATDVLLYGADGLAYNWGGVLPKVVPAASSPAATGGVGPNGWLDVSDASLREYLAATGGSSLVSAAKSIVSPGNVAKFGDTTGIATLEVPDDKDQRLLLRKKVTNPGDFATMQLLRQVDYGGGVAGHVGFGLNAKTEVRGSSLQSEWTGFFGLDNYSTASGTWPQNVAVYGQANKRSPSNTWAGCFEISDQNPGSGASGSAIGIEVTASANGADIRATPQRNGVHISISRGTINAQDCEWGRGVWVTAGPSAHWIYGFSAENAGSYAYHAKFTGVSADSALIRDESNCAVGVDLKHASYSTQTALWFKALDKIVWESTGKINTRWNSTNNRWELRNGDDVKFWVDTTTGQTSAGGGGTQALRYLSAKLSSQQTIATGSNNVVQYNSVGRDTTGGLITLDNGVLSVSPSVAEFEVVACVQCVSPDSGITLRMNFNEFANDGIYYPNPRHSHRAQNPCAHISTGVIYNPPTGSARLMYAVLDVSTNPVQVEASGASAIMVRVLSTR